MREVSVIGKRLHITRNDNKGLICSPAPERWHRWQSQNMSADLNRKFLKPEVWHSIGIDVPPKLRCHCLYGLYANEKRWWDSVWKFWDEDCSMALMWNGVYANMIKTCSIVLDNKNITLQYRLSYFRRIELMKVTSMCMTVPVVHISHLFVLCLTFYSVKKASTSHVPKIQSF